jgi:iron complex outermembrane recepter protein
MNKRILFTIAYLMTCAGYSASNVYAEDFRYAEDSRVLEEIVVTARKREESLEDVPVSISVISSESLNNGSVLDQYDLFELTPGVSYDDLMDRSAARPSIRGVQATGQVPTQQKVTSFLDGIPVVGHQGSLQFIGVEAVEILRGPQSAAFGRSTFAGAINYISKDPTEAFEGSVNAATSSLGRDSVKLSLSGPITETLGYTFDASFDEFDGHDKWVTTDGVSLGGTSTDYFTGKLRFAPNDKFDMEVRAIVLRSEDEPPVGWFISQAARDACTNTTLDGGAPYIQGEFDCDVSIPSGGIPANHHPEEAFTPGTDDHFKAQTFAVLEPGSYMDRDRVQGEVNYSFDNGQLLQVLASYSEDDYQRWFDSDFSDATPVFGPMTEGVSSMANPGSLKEQYAEVRWVSPADQSVRWLVGASYLDYELALNVYSQLAGKVLGLEDEANGGAPFLPVNIVVEETKNTGIFASVSWDVTDSTTLSVEARHQKDDITSIAELTGAVFSTKTTSIQPRVAINHTINEDVSVYAQYSKGTNPAGVNLNYVIPNVVASLAAANAAGAISYNSDTFAAFDEEELTNYEVGIKATLLDNRLQLAASLYRMEWEDMIQLTTLSWGGAWNDGSFDPDGVIYAAPVTRARTSYNSGTSTLDGIELEALWLIDQNWTARGAASFASAEYDKFCDPIAVADLGVTPTSTVAADGVLADCVDVSGNSLFQQPDNSLALGIIYQAPVGNTGWNWSANLDYRYQSEEFSFLDSANIMSLPARHIFNAGIELSDDKWQIRLYGNNLTDDDTPAIVRLEPDLNIAVDESESNFYVRPRTPREYGIIAAYKW